MSRDKEQNTEKTPRQVENPSIPGSDMTQGTTDGGTGTTSGEPIDRTSAQQESDPSPYSGTSGGHSRGGEVY